MAVRAYNFVVFRGHCGSVEGFLLLDNNGDLLLTAHLLELVGKD